jgi:hypothetical protein
MSEDSLAVAKIRAVLPCKERERDENRENRRRNRKSQNEEEMKSKKRNGHICLLH